MLPCMIIYIILLPIWAYGTNVRQDVNGTISDYIRDLQKLRDFFDDFKLEPGCSQTKEPVTAAISIFIGLTSLSVGLSSALKPNPTLPAIEAQTEVLLAKLNTIEENIKKSVAAEITAASLFDTVLTDIQVLKNSYNSYQKYLDDSNTYEFNKTCQDVDKMPEHILTTASAFLQFEKIDNIIAAGRYTDESYKSIINLYEMIYEEVIFIYAHCKAIVYGSVTEAELQNRVSEVQHLVAVVNCELFNLNKRRDTQYWASDVIVDIVHPKIDACPGCNVQDFAPIIVKELSNTYFPEKYHYNVLIGRNKDIANFKFLYATGSATSMRSERDYKGIFWYVVRATHSTECNFLMEMRRRSNAEKWCEDYDYGLNLLPLAEAIKFNCPKLSFVLQTDGNGQPGRIENDPYFIAGGYYFHREKFWHLESCYGYLYLVAFDYY